MDVTLIILISLLVLAVFAIALLWKLSQQQTHSQIRGDEQSKQFRNMVVYSKFLLGSYQKMTVSDASFVFQQAGILHE